MSADANQIIQIAHYAVTGILAILAFYRQFSKDKQDQTKQDSQYELSCLEERHRLQVKMAVLEQQIANEQHLLEKLDSKLDRIIEEK
jgi:ribosome assembly protein YihI (activator of Der GTPase)